MDRTNATFRVLIGSVAELAGLLLIFLVAREPDGWNVPMLALGVLILLGGTATTLVAAFQARSGGPK